MQNVEPAEQGITNNTSNVHSYLDPTQHHNHLYDYALYQMQSSVDQQGVITGQTPEYNWLEIASCTGFTEPQEQNLNMQFPYTPCVPLYWSRNFQYAPFHNHYGTSYHSMFQNSTSHNPVSPLNWTDGDSVFQRSARHDAVQGVVVDQQHNTKIDEKVVTEESRNQQCIINSLAKKTLPTINGQEIKRPLRCIKCPFITGDMLVLMDHIDVHFPVKTYICVYCYECFANDIDLTLHRRAKHCFCMPK